MRLLILDNYDSFTFNLVHLIEKVSDCKIEVHRNDKISLEAIAKFDKIILSPGPGVPSDAGILKDLISFYAPTKSILGVCLGHQACGEIFGAKIENLKTVFHGISTPLHVISKHKIFSELPVTFKIGRYHSWIISHTDFPDELEITGIDSENKIMAICHKNFDVSGVQFHPESILTEYGDILMRNWIHS